MPTHPALQSFHPATDAWFASHLGAPTPPQQDAWPQIMAGRHTLIAAPTGSGKTLAAFYVEIDRLVKEGLEQGALEPVTSVLYISPLKALGNDIQRNLNLPLDGIAEELHKQNLPPVDIRVAVRTGDTTPQERQRMLKRAPHILVTTPESLYLLLTSRGGRQLLGNVRTVIVDEIHALLGGKRGSHLSLSLERLENLTGRRLQRIGLSATQKPIETVAEYLVGMHNIKGGAADCVIVDSGHRKQREIRVEVPRSPLTALMSNDVWAEIYERLNQLIDTHRTTLIFVNTRRLAERLALSLGERIGAENVSSHHGSMSKEHRFDAEQRLKAGSLRVLVCTASMELGIDIGSVDLVVQISSPKSIAAFLQRVGRSGHHVGGIPKGILFPLTRDDLVECTALIDSIRRGELDQIVIPDKPIDILAQQIVAELGGYEEASVRAAAIDGTPVDDDNLLPSDGVPLDDIWKWVKRSWVYRNLTREEFDATLQMLADGYTTRRGRGGALLHLDRINNVARPRKGARLIALTNGGAIPDMFEYQMVLDPDDMVVGSLHEDFALESLPGDIFILGNRSWRMLRIDGLKIRVTDAGDAAPTIPFWLGEGPGRTRELSESVSRLRAELKECFDEGSVDEDSVVAEQHSEPDTVVVVPQLTDSDAVIAVPQLTERDAGVAPAQAGAQRRSEAGSSDQAPVVVPAHAGTQRHSPMDRAMQHLVEIGLDHAAAEQLATYLYTGYKALGVMPTRETLVMERFFDEVGDMHLVVHSPFGSRVNKAWGLSLRKKFCRTFNFELQAAANEDSIVISLGSVHSFELGDVFHYLQSASVIDTLCQALLDAPMFEVRWRWNASRALAVQRNRAGKRVPPQFQRMAAEDFVAQVFPDANACQENITGPREIPTHPLVQQTINDCMTEAMDVHELLEIVQAIEAGKVECVAKDLREPSPFAQEIINARPYAFLDDAPFEERRTLAIRNRSWMDPAEAEDFGALDIVAIERVREEAWPWIRSADELHDALMLLGFVTDEELHREGDNSLFIQQLVKAGRATLAKKGSVRMWIASERQPLFTALDKGSFVTPAHAGVQCLSWTFTPQVALPDSLKAQEWTPENALIELLRGRLEGLGPVTARELAASLDIELSQVNFALGSLEAEGFVFQGQYTPPAARGGNTDKEWCERRLLHRIHRYTIDAHRESIKPVSLQVYMQFLFNLHDIQPQSTETRVPGLANADTLRRVLAQLDGVTAPATAWESDILPARLPNYDPAWLDQLCISGQICWGRLLRPHEGNARSGPVKSTPLNIVQRRNVDLWQALAGSDHSHVANVTWQTNSASPAPVEAAPPPTSPTFKRRREQPLVSSMARASMPRSRVITSAPPDEGGEAPLSSGAMLLHGILQRQGAMFFTDLARVSNLLAVQVEHALAELVSAGMVTSDNFTGLRALLTPDANKPKQGSHERRRAIYGIEDAGRWSLLTPLAVHAAAESGTQGEAHDELGDEQLERLIAIYLKRWGVITRKVLEREQGAPPWRTLLLKLRRMELRGEIRGGRFIAGVGGEQFALADTVTALRKQQKLWQEQQDSNTPHVPKRV
ncbi:MAG: DEAD/DEAH box helicase, partial [Gammaproteobacteria bacterium]